MGPLPDLGRLRHVGITVKGREVLGHGGKRLHRHAVPPLHMAILAHERACTTMQSAALVHFLKIRCIRAFAGNATLQRGFWSRAGARRSQDNAQALLWRCARHSDRWLGRYASSRQPAGIVTALWRAKIASMAAISAAEMAQPSAPRFSSTSDAWRQPTSATLITG